MADANIQEMTSDELVLAGFGSLGRGKPAMAAKGAASNEIGADRFRRQMLERLNMLPRNVQKALQTRKAQISDAPYYATAPIAGTRAELIKLSQSEQIGVTNIDNGKLNKDRYLVLSGLRLLFDATAIDGAFTDVFPADLMNGEWEVELNGRKVFEKMPIRRFHDGFVGYNVDKPFGLYVLSNPKTVEPQTPIEFNVDLPNAVAGFLKIELIGTTVYGF
ncbi:MAG: hypothetical protein KDD36_09260 [Flavobacteriales bacterium]|nr:hypothetical protein [Flavobacteriales bacterium]